MVKRYQYTILKQDGTKEVLEPCRKKSLGELYRLLNCRTIEIVPSDYYKDMGFGRCTVYADENGRDLNGNVRNPHFKVLNSLFGEEYDVVGNVIKEEVYHGR